MCLFLIVEICIMYNYGRDINNINFYYYVFGIMLYCVYVFND